MSVGPLGAVTGSVAGTQLAQAKGSDLERAQHEAGNEQRRVQAEQKAEQAAGIGEADGEDHEAAERDADGRRLWEDARRRTRDAPADAASAATGGPQGSDPTGQSGTLLDLSG
jgi:hypothetical protein